MLSENIIVLLVPSAACIDDMRDLYPRKSIAVVARAMHSWIGHAELVVVEEHAVAGIFSIWITASLPRVVSEYA